MTNWPPDQLDILIQVIFMVTFVCFLKVYPLALLVPDIPKIVLVEDEDLLRSSLEQLLIASGYKVKGLASGTEALDLLQSADGQSEQWDVIVMDVHLNGDNGLTIQKILRDSGIQTPFVFMSAHQNAQDVNQAWRDGAHNFLFKPFTPEELLAAIESAIAFGTRDSSILAPAPDILEKFNRLTPRQKEVLRLVACGLSNTQISIQLDISARTVKMHRESMMHRFGFRHVADLVRFHDACKDLF